jgi:hypothetical protein
LSSFWLEYRFELAEIVFPANSNYFRLHSEERIGQWLAFAGSVCDSTFFSSKRREFADRLEDGS